MSPEVEIDAEMRRIMSQPVIESRDVARIQYLIDRRAKLMQRPSINALIERLNG